ncbi:methyltransferase [Variovorax sp. J2P1-59]|uniref:methyltransferase n=1 Tax=Variovorax flavidus TaxID=3053501 RepID=UPI0025763782|nr:methyltransferase [Variovorax sp. J2P1-59]MDM0078219.1 methyltransferase [Variovorax sp. J2P1-59]
MQSDSNPAITIRRLIDGYQVSQAIHVAATLGIADLLAKGSRTADALAADTGTHAPTLYRLLRALASVEILREGNGRTFELAPLGQQLRADTAGSMAGWAAFIGSPGYWQAWGGLLHSVRTGENAFQHVHGADVWSYRASRPEESALFDRAMTALSRQASAALLAACDFGRFRTVVDVGGGTGALLAAVLTAHPGLQGILFDQPHVVAAAGAFMQRAGVSDRARIVGGSFFDEVPEGADAYVLRSVVHDWDDVDGVRILATVRKAMAADGCVLLVERVIAPPNEGRDAKFSDLNMLVAPGGRERTREEFEALLGPAGLRVAAVIDAGAFGVIEAVTR